MVDFFDISGIIIRGIFGGREMRILNIVSAVTVLVFTVETATAFTVTASCFERKLPETTNVLMCSTDGNAMYYIDNGIISDGCIRQDVKGSRPWGYRKNPRNNRTETIVTMGSGFGQYFWIVPGHLTTKCKRKWK